MSLALRHNLGSEGGHCALSEVLVIILKDVEWLLDLIELLDSDVTSGLKTIGNLKWVNTFVEKLLRLLKDSTSQNNNTCGSISNFVILGGRELDEESSGLMMNFHLFKDSGSVISNDDFSIWGDKHLVHTLWSERSLEETGNSSGSENVDLF